MVSAIILLFISAINTTTPAWSQESNPAPISVVGAIPYSNQWKFEEANSFLYLSYNSQHMTRSEFKANLYTAEFASTRSAHPTVDYFIRIARFSDLEEKSFLRDFSLWGRYGLGVGMKQGKLVSDDFQLSSASETGYLAHGIMRLGLNIAYERLRFICPYLGVQGLLAGYRHTASISGAEVQGGSAGYEFVGGMHFPVLFNRRVSFYGEARYTTFVGNKFLVYANGFFAAGGLGISI